MKYENNIIFAAHRGDRKNCPENTMPAFENALNFGVDMIETDIHMTKDGELIIMHDRNTLRTTGHDGFTNEMTLEQLRALDAGHLFSDKFTCTVVPTVKEFIDLIKNTNMQVNWELKDYPFEVGDDFAFAAAEKLVAMVVESGLAERSMFNSFSDRVLEHIYVKYDKQFTIHGQGMGKFSRTKDKSQISPEELYQWCCVYPDVRGEFVLDYPENFTYCVERNILPCICIEDNLESYKRCLDLGCRMFTSNDIYEGDKILRQLNVR